jgi:cytochrome b pre-mRNA-processing protein 3
MLTVRFRALPDAYGRRYADCIVDHFFQDVEDRIRAIMQPSHDYKPYIFTSTFYINPNAPTGTDKNERLSRAPDRLVTQQLKIFKEQWTGFSLSLDLGLINGDMEMAGAVWRNLLGARGASGIAFPDDPSAPTFRRTVNLLGGTEVNPTKIDFEKEAVTDDESGVHDFPPAEADKYLTYPELMLDIVQYIRRELVRLEALSDEEVLDKDWREMGFGRVRPNTAGSKPSPSP